MKTIEEINKINQSKTKLERDIESLLNGIEISMTWKDNTSFNEKNSIMFRMSSIKAELKKLEQEHLNK